MVRHCLPASNLSQRNSNTSFTGAESRYAFLSMHQPTNCFQALLYADSVEVLQNFLIMSVTRSDRPCAEENLRRHTKRLEGGVPSPQEDGSSHPGWIQCWGSGWVGPLGRSEVEGIRSDSVRLVQSARLSPPPPPACSDTWVSE